VLWTATKRTHEQHLMKSSTEKRITQTENSKIENRADRQREVGGHGQLNIQTMTVLSRSRT
jgi:hypothetical protein